MAVLGTEHGYVAARARGMRLQCWGERDGKDEATTRESDTYLSDLKWDN
jgi:hypothetical protein